MKLTARSYPRPVVGNGDDVNAGFQSPIEVATKGEVIDVSVLFQNGSSTLKSLIKKERVAYAVHLECSSTFFRHSYETHEESLAIEIPRASLHGRVDGVVMAVAKTRMANYKVDASHPDYGSRQFEVEPGDVLAVAEPFRFDVDIEAEDLQKISSIMVICPDHDREQGEMVVHWHEPRIKIILPKEDFARYKMVRQSPLSQSLAGMLVALPVLTEAVRQVTTYESEFSDMRWHRCVKRRIEELEIAANEEPLVIAQKILANPVSRSLQKCFHDMDFGD
jgi:hypothetical protein